MSFESDRSKICKIPEKLNNMNTALKRFSNGLEQVRDVAWTHGVEDRKHIFEGMSDAGRSIAKSMNKLHFIAKSADATLKLSIKKLVLTVCIEKSINCYSFKSIGCSESKSKEICLNSASIKVCATKIIRLANDIGELAQDIKNINTSLDDKTESIICNKFGSINKEAINISQNCLKILKLGMAMNKIAERYEKANKDIAKKVAEINNGKTVTYGNGIASNSHIVEYEGGSYVMPTFGMYTTANNIKNEISTAVGKEEIIKAVKARDSKLPKNKGNANNNNYNGLCALLVRDKMKYATGDVNFPVDNGYKNYDAIRNYYNRVKNGKYNAESISGADSLVELLKRHKGEILTNVVVSYTRGNEVGHTLVIDRIENGKVYYSDSFSTTKFTTSANCMDVDTFIEVYKKIGYTMYGVNYIYAK